MTDLTLRRTLGRPLEWEEMDVNMENLDSDSPWNVASGHIWYSGKVSLYGDDATYDLDFTDGVANVATIGTNDADLEVHVDGARKFKIITNTQNRFQVTTDGKVGINIDSDPTYELDVDGNIRARTTLFANQTFSNSFYDGTATLSGGSLTNAVNGEFTGQVRFGSLYDIGNDRIIRQLDVDDLTFSADRIPTSEVVYTHVDNVDSDIQEQLDSLNAKLASTGLQEVTDIGSVTTNDIKVGNITSTGITDSAASTTITIDPTNKVGIGTQSPDKRLDVLSGTANSDVAAFSGTATGRGLVISTFDETGTTPDAGVDFDAISRQGEFSFSTDGIERMRIDTNGNVGVGTNNPSPSLGTGVHIKGSGYGNITLQKSADISGHMIDFTDENNDVQYTIGTNFSSAGQNLLFSYGSPRTVGMILDATGNVGIGTDTPSNHLVVEGATGKGALEVSTTQTGELQTLAYHRSDAAWLTHTTRGQRIIFKTDTAGATERMRINSVGDVLIGPSPSYTSFLTANTGNLQLKGGIIGEPGPNGVFEISNYRSAPIAFFTSGDVERMRIDGDGNIDVAGTSGNKLRFSSHTTASIIDAGVSGITSASLRFNVNGDEKVRIEDNGNVGIGTDSPSEPLEINTGSTSRIKVTDGTYNLTTGVWASAPRLSFGTPSNGNAQIDYNAIADTLALAVNNSAGIVSFSTNSAERMRIASNGNVGIGTDKDTFKVNVLSASSTSTNLESTATSSLLRLTNSGGIASVGSEGSALFFNTGSNERMRIIDDGKVGIGGTPASGGIGGGTALLQVAGDGYFSGTVNAGSSHIGTMSLSGAGGAAFLNNTTNTGVVLTNNATAFIPTEDGTRSFGSVSYRFRDAHFSGTVNAGTAYLKNGSLGANYGTQLGSNGGYLQLNNLFEYIEPSITSTLSLGSTVYKFKDGHFSGSVGADSFIKLGGTSSQFLMADGSVTTESSITAGQLANSFTVQGTAFNGSAPKTVTFTGGTGISVSGTTITNDAPDQTVSITGSGATSVSGTYPTFTVSSTDTTYTGGTGITVSGTTITNSAPDQTVSITGAGSTTVTGSYPNFTVTSVGTTYTAGTGLTLVGTEFRNSAPDQTVSLSGTGGISVSGTYPSFTINNTSPDQTVVLSGSGGIAISGSYPNFTIDGSGASGTSYTAGNGLTLVGGTEFKMSGSYTGSFTATGDIIAYSDMALKEDINPISAALEKVAQLTGYTFRRKGEEKVSTGVMAQEVQKVLPEAVHNNEGTLGVAYGNMVGLLIEAVKELSGKVESLESELNRTK